MNDLKFAYENEICTGRFIFFVGEIFGCDSSKLYLVNYYVRVRIILVVLSNSVCPSRSYDNIQILGIILRLSDLHLIRKLSIPTISYTGG